MVRDKPMTTRVSQEAYKSILQRCADRGCSTYEYLRHLVHADLGLDEDGSVPGTLDEAEEPVQTELIVKDERIEGRIDIVG